MTRQVVKLAYPIQNGSEMITELVCERRLVAGDFRGINSSEIKFDDMLILIGRLFAQPSNVIDKLDATDMFKAMEVVNGFLPSGPQTGPKL